MFSPLQERIGPGPNLGGTLMKSRCLPFAVDNLLATTRSDTGETGVVANRISSHRTGNFNRFPNRNSSGHEVEAENNSPTDFGYDFGGSVANEIKSEETEIAAEESEDFQDSPRSKGSRSSHSPSFSYHNGRTGSVKSQYSGACVFNSLYSTL